VARWARAVSLRPAEIALAACSARRALRLAAAAAALLAGAGAPAALARDPQFALLTPSELTTREGGIEENVLCLSGVFPAGRPVLVLGEDAPGVCILETGEQAGALSGNGRCTLLVGLDACQEVPLGIAVVGSLPAGYRTLERRPVVDRSSLAAMGKAVARSGLIARLVELSAEWGGPSSAREIERAPAEAYTLSTFSRGPVFLQYRIRAKGGARPQKGPLVVLESGSAKAPFKSACGAFLSGFRLGGVDYVHASWGCCNCGWRMDEIYGLEGARLRRVFSTAALSD
jgi:hypothetical protein